MLFVVQKPLAFWWYPFLWHMVFWTKLFMVESTAFWNEFGFVSFFCCFFLGGRLV